MLTIAEAAKHSTVSEGLIRQWIREGTLPHFRLGGKGKRGSIRIAVEDLDGVLASFKVSEQASAPPPKPKPKPTPKAATLKYLRMPS